MATSLSLLILSLTSLLLALAEEVSSQDAATQFRGTGLIRVADSALESSLNLSRVVQVSHSPKVFLYKGLLTPGECNHIIRQARRKLGPPIKKGTATFLRKYQDPIVRAVEDRVTAWLFPPRKTPDSLKALRYNDGQSFDVHYDFFRDSTETPRLGPRVASLILFLSDVHGGGEVVFPKSKDVQSNKDESWSPCAHKGVAVRASRGDALLFFHLTPSGNADPNDDHEDCPVPHGQVKWAAEKWIVVQKYMTTRDPDECLDENPKCEDWAANGECKRNPDFMIGKGGYIGQCRKACKVCKPKEETPRVASN